MATTLIKPVICRTEAEIYANRATKVQVNSRSIIVSIVSFLISVIGTASCTTAPYALLDIVPSPVPMPDGHYREVAWLEPTTLAFQYLPTPDTADWDTRLMVYKLDGEQYQLVPKPLAPECVRIFYGRINRLPNGELGYLWECIPEPWIGRDFRVQQWSQVTGEDRERYHYPVPFWATAFSFAPDMKQWLQEETGDGLFNKLHYVIPDTPPLRLLEESFARAGHPAWMPDGHIIFAGTPQLPESGTNLFSGLPGITAGLAEPWSLYLTDLDSLLNGTVGEEQSILSDIQYIEAVKTSPDGRFVSFLGTIDGNEGLWVYDLDSGELARLWAGFGPYDWSPDGKEIMVLVRDPEATVFRGHPARIELPESLTE